MNARLERAMAELVAGRDGGWSLWLGALAGLEAAVQESRLEGEMRFAAHPRHELQRLVGSLEASIQRAALAADVRAIVLDEGEASATSIATLLLERANELVAARI